jgi:hypothetical protein
MSSRPAVNLVFAHNYHVQVLDSYNLVNPLEKLHQFPTKLDEGDRTGTYVRVLPANSSAWIGFFALGFDSPDVASGIYSCPDPDWICVVAGGYGYLVNVRDPEQWRQIEQRPIVQVKAVPELKLVIFSGFTSITVLAESQRVWTSERLSWEGISISKIEGTIAYGKGWDAIADKEVPFELDLLTGKSRGGAAPQHAR